MTLLPLDVDEVLEGEYEALHGPLEKKLSALYEKDDILDEAWVRQCLAACGLSGHDLLAVVNALVVSGVEVEKLQRSPTLTDRGRELLKIYSADDIEKTAD